MIEVLGVFGLVAAGIRALVVFNGLALMLFSSRRKIEWGRSMRIAFPEPFLVALAVGWVAFHGPLAPIQGVWPAIVGAGAAASAFGIIVFFWSLVANPGVGTGHYTEEGQVVARSGPYALVRHPLYSAAVFLWLGLALTSADWVLLTVTFAYVIPAYFHYARDEEEMMIREFGAEYAEYRNKVPMLFPRPLAVWD